MSVHPNTTHWNKALAIAWRYYVCEPLKPGKPEWNLYVDLLARSPRIPSPI